MPTAATTAARLKIMPAPADTAPRRPLRPRMFGRIAVSAEQQRIVARFVARVNAIANSAQCRLKCGDDRQARIEYGFARSATTKPVMLAVLRLMLSTPRELPVCDFFALLEGWSYDLPDVQRAGRLA